MNEIEYVFGTGDGTVHVWSSEADLDLARTGTADALQLDFDGDGLADDALWDPHGTGVADIAALDLDDDGLLDHFYTDPTGLGTWGHQITGSAADAVDEPLEWIVRSGPLPDTSSETHNVVGGELADVLADYPLNQHDSPQAGWDADRLLDHVGLSVDQRGRVSAGDEHPQHAADMPFGI
ncbi:pullulanase [Nocardia sp. NPDC050710]|uniref:pullulanase n=1 Tax=Nocardia sp. NPDC050710 TaxID=3157220 RepID=UPI0033F31EC6